MSAFRFPVLPSRSCRFVLRLAGLCLACLYLAVNLSVPQAMAQQGLTVFAAASLQTALDQVAADWQAQGHGKIALSYAGSPTLAQQIDQGAPADLFVSADTDWMQWLVSRKHVAAGSVLPLLGNSLVLIAPANPQASPEPPVVVTAAFDLSGKLGNNRLAMADPRTVPAGKYGRAALERLGFWNKVSALVAPTDNVRMALSLVARREAGLGIVYHSDALAEPRVTVLGQFAPDSHPPIVYPAAVLARSTHPEARNFLAFLQGAQARQRFVHAGFTALAEAKP